MLKSDSTIGILVDNKAPVKIYETLAIKHRLNLLFFTPNDINWTEKTTAGLYLSKHGWRQRERSYLPNVIYNRLYPQQEHIQSRLTLIKPAMKIFNHITQFDKWNIYEVLSQTSLALYLPKTYQYKKDILQQAVIEHKSIIIKPCKGYQGLGLLRIELLENNRYAIAYELDFPIVVPNQKLVIELIDLIMQPKSNIIQEYIALATINHNLFDIRALVQKARTGSWEVTAITSRLAYSNYFITNIYQQLKPTAVLLRINGFDVQSILTSVKEISMQTAIELEANIGHLAEISVDFGIDQAGKLWIIEVNGKPNKQIYQELDDPELVEKVYLSPLLYALYLNKPKIKRLQN